ncbi:hypothetical protein D3C86_1053330 [compost metagenome]
MHMGDPPTIFRVLSHVPYKRTSLKVVPGFQASQSFMSHVPPQRQEWRATFRRVLEHDQAAITQRLMLDLDALHHAGNRRIERRACGHDQVDTDVNDPTLPFDEPRLKRRVGVDGPFLAPWPDAERYLVLGRKITPPLRRLRWTLLG